MVVTSGASGSIQRAWLEVCFLLESCRFALQMMDRARARFCSSLALAWLEHFLSLAREAGIGAQVDDMCRSAMSKARQASSFGNYGRVCP
jgi:hypothetical protein